MQNYSPFVKFTYTLLDPDGLPQQKSWLLNLSYVVSIESGNNNDIKIIMSNDQIIVIELGKDNDAPYLVDEILNLSAEGVNYNVYRINSYEKR